MTDKALLAADVFQFRDGQLVVQRYVVQEEVSAEQTASGVPMFPAPKPDPA